MFTFQNNLKELPQVGVILPSSELGSAASMRGDIFIMDDEIWIKIIDSKYHEVSSHLRFRTSFFLSGKRIMKQHISKTGYYSIRINGKTQKCHRLIAAAFIPNPQNLPFINHKDGNKLNNSIDNLEWCTNKHNIQHAFKNGLIPKCVGEAQGNVVLKENQVKDILKSNKSSKTLSKLYGVHISTIQTIKNGKSWGWLSGIVYKKRNLDKVKISSIYKSELTQDEIAIKFNVCRQYVNSIKIGKIYSEITGHTYKRKMKLL